MELDLASSCDVLVLGSGIAGISAALTAAEAGASVILACKGKLFSGSSFYPGTWGLGLVGPADPLDVEDLITTIENVGCGMADGALVRTLVEGIHPAIEKVRDLGVKLRRADNGEQLEFMGMMGTEELCTLLDTLKEAGFTISLDDFGAEYSNLAILTDLAFHEVKLDKSLINELESNHRSRIVTSHAIGLCRELDLITSVAEGIETSGQLDMLADMHCEVGQGYYFDAPLPVPVFEGKYLREREDT